MLDNYLAENLNVVYDFNKRKLIELTIAYPDHKDLINQLYAIDEKNDKLMGQFLIVYCHYSADYIDKLFPKHFKQAEMNNDEIALIESIKEYPSNITKECTIDQSSKLLPYKINALMEFEFGVKNLPHISKMYLDLIPIELADQIKTINEAITKIANIPANLTQLLFDLGKHTYNMRTAIDKFKKLKKDKATQSQINALKDQLNEMIKVPHPINLVMNLKEFQNDIEEQLKQVANSVNRFQKWLRHLINFKATYAFSDTNNLQRTLATRVKNIRTFIDDSVEMPGKSKPWLIKLIEFLTIITAIFGKVNIRTINLSTDYMNSIKRILQKDQNDAHQKICKDFLTVIDDYEELYETLSETLINSDDIREFIKYDYVRTFRVVQPKIDRMNDEGSQHLIQLFDSTFDDLEPCIDKIIVLAKAIKKGYKDALSYSNGIRFILYYVKDLYENNAGTDDDFLYHLMKRKSQFTEYLNLARDRADGRWKLTMKKHRNDLKMTINELFKSIIPVVDKFEDFLRFLNLTNQK